MRAARAARSSSIGVDGLVAFRGGAPSEDVVVMPRGKVAARVSRPLSPDRLASTTAISSRAPFLAAAAMTKKPKRVPKGVAAKRSRALRTALDGRVGGGRRGPSLSNDDATSRFPMPYPGVEERGRPPRAVPATRSRASHHRAKLKSPEGKVRAGHIADREPLRMPVGSPAGVARKHRKRPRSAVLAPSRTEFGRPAAPPPTVSGLLYAKKEKNSGQFSSTRMKRTANNSAELSGAASSRRHEGRVVGGGMKMMRPKSAPSRRGDTNEKSKTCAGGGRGGGVLKVLSHVSDGRYKTPDELRIMKWVVLRETYLTKLHGVVSTGRKRANAKTASKNGPVSSDQHNAKRQPKLFNLLTELSSLLRRITVEIVEAVERWRGGPADRSNMPFIWGSSNYLVKAAGDTAFLARLPGLEQHLGVAISENPFLCHVRLDGRPACLPPTTAAVVAGKGRGKAAGHGSSHPTSVCFGASDSLGVSAERLEAAAAVLYREVIRASGGSKGGGGGERNRSREPTRVNSSKACWPAGSGTAAPPEAENDPRQPQRSRSSSLPVDITAVDADPDPDPPPDEQCLDFYKDDSSVGGGESRLVNEWRRQVSLGHGNGSENQEDYYGISQDGQYYYGDDGQNNGQDYGIRQDSQDYYGGRQDGQDYYGGGQDDQEYYYGEIQNGQYDGSQPITSGSSGPQGADSDPHHSLGYQPTAPFRETDNDASPQRVNDPTNFPESTNEPEPSSDRAVDQTTLVADENPDDLGNGTGGAMEQQRGSPFLDVFNLCDGILSNLKGAGLVSRSTESIYEPSSLVADMGGKRDDPFVSVVAGTGDEDDGHVSSEEFPTEPEVVAHEETGGEAPALRGSAYEGQTRNLLAEVLAPNFSKERRKAGPHDREERSDGELVRTLWNRHTPEELTAKCFAAWYERTEARQLHRDLKAARHHRHGQLRRAMSVWDNRRATILGGHLAEAFAGRFGLSTRFFVRYAFDALRAHAKGNRVAARNRAAMGRVRAKLESVGTARLRQAWQRWLQAVEIRDSAYEDAFATLAPDAGSKTGAATEATGRQGSEEGEWAQWLGDEGSLSGESPSGDFVESPPRVAVRGIDSSAATAAASVAPASSAGDGKTSDGQQLSPKLSFRGLGARIMSMRSFRDKGDKTQAKRQQQQLRAAGAFGASSASPTTPRLDPSAHKLASGVIDAFQAAPRGDANAQNPPVDVAASRIQHAWRASREQRVAARIDRSASLIQLSWRLRCRRCRAGFQVVRAWRRRSRLRARTLNRALIEAAGEGDLRAVAFLLRPAVGWCVGADANATAGANRSTALHVVCRHARCYDDAGGTKEAESLARRSAGKARIGCDECGLTTTETASVKRKLNQQGNNLGENRGRRDRPDRVGVVRALVEAGAVVEAKDSDGFTPMMVAAGEGCGETVVALATAGAEVDAAESGVGRRTPLVIAAQKSNASSTAALLEYGARVDVTAADGLTPLHEAVGEGSIAVAEMLVRAGARVDAKNESAGMTPLHLAVANDQHAAARLLVHSGANVCLPDARGLTPLRLTVEMADAPTVALLLAAEPPPDLSVEDQNGGTILHAACRLGLTDIARLLLEAGADPHARNAHGKTPELMALDLGHSECAGIFYNMEIHSFSPHGKRQAVAAAAAAAASASASASDDSSDASGERQSHSDRPRRGIPEAGDMSEDQEGEEGEEGPWKEERLDDDSGPQRENYAQRRDNNGDETGAELLIDDAVTSRDLRGEEEAGRSEEKRRLTRGGSIAVSRARNKWLSLIDRESGSTYYQHEQSGLTQWEAPEGDGGGETGGVGGETEPIPWKGSSTVIRAGHKWLSLIDRKSGSTYYQNEKSGLTQWEVPRDDGGETGTGGNTHEEEEGNSLNYEESLPSGEEGGWSSLNAQYPALDNDGDALQEIAKHSPEASEIIPSRAVSRARNKWLSLIDRESGSTYYQNEKSGLTQWETPEEDDGGETGRVGGEAEPIAWKGSSTVIRAGNKWLSLIDRASGSTYYQNENSGLTQWEPPEDGGGEAGGVGSNKHDDEEEEEGSSPNYEEPLPPGGEESGWSSSNAYYPAVESGGGDALQATYGESGGGAYYNQNDQPDVTQWEALEGGGGEESGTGTEPPFVQEGSTTSSAVIRERNNTWVSLIDSESGTTYYQNVQSGLTQWEVPQDGTIDSPDEAAYGDNLPI